MKDANSLGLSEFIYCLLQSLPPIDASMIVALCALGLSTWQVVSLRRHHRISVRPHLTVWRDHHNDTYKVTVYNNGLGPAFVKRFAVLVDEVEVSGIGSEPVKIAINTVYSGQVELLYTAFFAPGLSVKEKGEHCIAVFRVCSKNSMSDDEVEQRFLRADLIIEYESLYGQAFVLDTRTLKRDNERFQ